MAGHIAWPIPRGMRGYRLARLRGDAIAGLTLAAVAIPEVMGYTTITKTPVVTGLYTLMLPAIAFALLGSSRLLAVGADSATAAVLTAGLAGSGLSGSQPGSGRWLALCGLTAVVTGALLLAARAARLGFLGNFLSAPVLIGFLSGVGVRVASEQLPALIGVRPGQGNWLDQQRAVVAQLGQVSWPTLGYGAATVGTIVVLLALAPKVPGAIVAVAGSLVVAAATDASARGVAVVGQVSGGLPGFSLPDVSLGDVGGVLATASACAFVIIAQSAATSRSVARRHGETADVDRDLIGLAAANLVAGLSGSFVVNGSPTKTRVLDLSGASSQVANLVVAVATGTLLLAGTGIVAGLPSSVLAGIVLVVGLGLIDLRGLGAIWRRRRGEFAVALVTAAAVVVIDVGVAIVVAIALSLATVIARQYNAPAFVLVPRPGGYDYRSAEPGVRSEPGLVVFRFDAPLFFANASAFAAKAEQVVSRPQGRVAWFVLDCAGITDIDYSAGLVLDELIGFLHARGIHVILARAEPALLETLRRDGLLSELDAENIFPDLDAAIASFRSRRGEVGPGGPPAE